MGCLGVVRVWRLWVGISVVVGFVCEVAGCEGCGGFGTVECEGYWFKDALAHGSTMR